MEYRDAVHARKMTRSFEPDTVDDGMLDGLLKDALRAPSAGFTQGVDLLVLTESAVRSTFWDLISDPEWRTDSIRSEGLTAAPVIVVPIGNPAAYAERYADADKHGSRLAGLEPSSWPVPYWTVDAAFVAMSLLIGVADAGLGALFFHLQAREHELLKGFAIPANHLPIGAIAIGHPKDALRSPQAAPRKRRSRSEVIHRERW